MDSAALWSRQNLLKTLELCLEVRCTVLVKEIDTGNRHLVARRKVDGPEAKQTGGECLEHFVCRFCPAQVHLLCIDRSTSGKHKFTLLLWLNRYGTVVLVGILEPYLRVRFR